MSNGMTPEAGVGASVRTSQRALVAEESFLGPTTDPLRAGTDGVHYSIRVPSLAVGVRCPTCEQSFWAAGPTGYADETPICDACLLQACHPLGMLLALSLVTRQLANLSPKEGKDFESALQEVGVFARVYEQVASQEGPPRRFELPEEYRVSRGAAD